MDLTLGIEKFQANVFVLKKDSILRGVAGWENRRNFKNISLKFMLDRWKIVLLKRFNSDIKQLIKSQEDLNFSEKLF